ncbi:MAG: amidohydrolase family protein [Bacteroidetes bacterium]|nr:amidohydrolase family protein [Bacteroidota bacterium]
MKFNISFLPVLVALFFSVKTAAQTVPVPAPVQMQAILVKGATAHLGNGQVIENSLVAFENGKFTVVDNAAIKRGFPNHREIDATGKQLYPGFIAPNTTLGLQEIEAVRATADNADLGGLNPNLRAIIAYNTDSQVTPTVRSMGVLLAEIAPQGGRISGTSSIVQLDAWNWEDAAYVMDCGIHMGWPSSSRFNFREGRIEKNETYEKEIRELEDFFSQAQAWLKNPAPAPVNLRFEAMKGLFEGKNRLFVHANSAQSIQEAVLFAEKFQLAPVIVGGNDAWMITEFLKQHKVAVILDSTQRLPSREDEDIDQPFKTPALLQAAGVAWCFGHDGFWQQRNLAFQAGQAVGFGLAYEDAVKSLTSSTARILGIDKTAGTLEAGKDATFFISEGDALDMRSAKVTQAFIQGREINLDNKQDMLYRRFQAKYKSR